MQAVNMNDIGSLSVGAVNNVVQNVSKSKNDFSQYLRSSSGSNANDKSGNAGVKKATKEIPGQKQTTADTSLAKTSQKVTKSQSDNDMMSKDNNVTDIDEVNDAIMDKVKTVLDIDDETLNNAMTALGLMPTDLLDVSNLIKLITYVNSADSAADMLTSEDMMMDFKELSDSIADIDWEGLTGMSMEDFAKQLESVLSDDNSAVVPDMTTAENMADIMDDASKTEEAVAVQVDSEKVSSDDTENLNILTDSASKNDISDKQVSDTDIKSDTAQEQKGNVVTVSVQEESASDESSEDMTSEQTEEVQPSVTRDDESSHVDNMGFLQNLNQAVNDAADVSQSQPVQQMQQAVDIVNQVVERIKVTMGTDNTSMELQLNPENLGKVLLSVTSKNGVMTANFTVQSEEARQALESQMYTLRENLENKNLKVEVVEVQIADSDFTQRDQTGSEDQKNPNNGNGKQMRFDFEEDDDDQETSEKENADIRRSVMTDSGNNVDYTA